MLYRIRCALCGIGFFAAGIGMPVAQASVIPYPHAGTPNPVTYSFEAAATGDIVAYFYRSNAGFTESLGLIDVTTGAQIGGLGLQNNTTAIGARYDFGSVTVGDTLEFFIHIVNGGGLSWANETGANIYSIAANNQDRINHVYAQTYAAGNGIPAGTYVGFEDLLANLNTPDWNYTDEQFVFTNTGGIASNGSTVGSPVTTVPEPSMIAIVIVYIAAFAAYYFCRRAAIYQ